MADNFRSIGATTFLSPVPSVLVGCADFSQHPKPNIITIAWVGIICSNPPMLSISVRKSRLSHTLISNTGEFTVNLMGRNLTKSMDYCGVRSGRDVDKFKELNLTPISASPLKNAPAIQ